MTYPEGMKATYICDRCGETITDNFDYTSGLYKEMVVYYIPMMRWNRCLIGILAPQ